MPHWRSRAFATWDRDSHGVADGLTPPAFADLLPWCHHMTFCTLGQWEQLGPKARERRIPCSLRVSAGEMCRSGIPLEELPDRCPMGSAAFSFS